MTAQIIHEDVHGTIIDHPEEDFLELRWYDSSSALVGTPPALEGPADFPTAFFATRAEARAWLDS